MEHLATEYHDKKRFQHGDVVIRNKDGEVIGVQQRYPMKRKPQKPKTLTGYWDTPYDTSVVRRTPI